MSLTQSVFFSQYFSLSLLQATGSLLVKKLVWTQCLSHGSWGTLKGEISAQLWYFQQLNNGEHMCQKQGHGRERVLVSIAATCKGQESVTGIRHEIRAKVSEINHWAFGSASFCLDPALARWHLFPPCLWHGPLCPELPVAPSGIPSQKFLSPNGSFYIVHGAGTLETTVEPHSFRGWQRRHSGWGVTQKEGIRKRWNKPSFWRVIIK